MIVFQKQTKKTNYHLFDRSWLFMDDFGRFFNKWTNFPFFLNYSFVFLNEWFFRTHFLKTVVCLPTNFKKKTFDKRMFFWMNDFIKLTIVLNKRYYWTKNFNVWSFSEKTNEIDGKWTIISRTNLINYFLNDWKERNEMDRSWTNNERNKKTNARISKFINLILKTA